ncbi:hypothetical protein N7494_010045 [Penicillium frequentans]|uniref:Purine-cytosine permease fcyB n=1 Tax=Penicillium frequentans TaxID=3151616 RepID=A0AAD6GE06_9EURO|nr:hypothetical protein N7494_010045 [Penicillium glabrum]
MSTDKAFETAGVDDISKTQPWFSRRMSIEEGALNESLMRRERRRQPSSGMLLHSGRFSANMAIATLNIGSLGGSMGLAFWDCFIVIVVVNLFSDLLPAWTATAGLTGLRMTTFSRYSFGYWGNMLVVVFSMVATTGWNAINSISGASVLNALSNGKCPTWAGVIIICTLVWIICALGITWIHRLDTFVWVFPFIVWCVAAGTGASSFTAESPKHLQGADRAAAVLSYVASIFSFSLSWVNCAADYNVRMPHDTPRWKIFGATYVGIFVPSVLVQSLGAALYTGTIKSTVWKDAYSTSSIGGLLQMSLEPAGGFGKFLMVLAALSSIPYFNDALETFLSVIGYWTVIHATVVMEEHFIFRRRWSAYDLDAWNNPAALPFGWASIGAFCFGFVGAALGMHVTWYSAPIASLIGSGANIGHELTFAFSAIIFPLLRWAENRHGGLIVRRALMEETQI